MADLIGNIEDGTACQVTIVALSGEVPGFYLDVNLLPPVIEDIPCTKPYGQPSPFGTEYIKLLIRH